MTLSKSLFFILLFALFSRLAYCQAQEMPGITFNPRTIAGHRGFFRVGQAINGHWWMLDPDNKPFFCKAVTSVNQGLPADEKRPADGLNYYSVVGKKYGSADAFRDATLNRLKSWGFNALGAWSNEEFWDQHFPYTIMLGLTLPHGTPLIPDLLLPDVFDPEWEKIVDAQAQRVCTPRRNSRDLIGYFSDNELNWAQVRGDIRPLVFDPSQEVLRAKNAPSLLQRCLGMEAGRPARKAAWAFIYKRHKDIAGIAKAWNLPALSGEEQIRVWNTAQQAIFSPGYVDDDELFSHDFAARYFRLTTDAIRRYDPNHLILGCRFGGPPGPAVLSAIHPDTVDVVSANNYRDTMYDRIDTYAQGTHMPVLIGEFAWVTGYFFYTPLKTEPVGGMTQVERMIVKGQAALERAITHPALIGYTWYRWVDKIDFVPPISYGLVTLTDEPNWTHIGMLKSINDRAESIAAHAPVSSK